MKIFFLLQILTTYWSIYLGNILDPNKVLLIGDSRVRRLGEFAVNFRHDLLTHCEVVSYSGRTLSFIIGELLEILKTTKFSTVIVFAGVNDLTKKRNNQVRLNVDFIQRMPASLMSEIQYGQPSLFHHRQKLFFVQSLVYVFKNIMSFYLKSMSKERSTIILICSQLLLIRKL